LHCILRFSQVALLSSVLLQSAGENLSFYRERMLRPSSVATAPVPPSRRIGAFSLLAYEDVKKHARQIAAVTQQRYMPPWLPEARFRESSDESRPPMRRSRQFGTG
jgi:hypothetical protein